MAPRRLAPRILAAAVALAALAPAPLQAKPDAGKVIADEAAGHFKAGRYLQAAELFERSFALQPGKLVRLRNAGRAYEEAGRLEYACLIFERYLQLAPPSKESAEVRQRLTRLREQLALTAAARPEGAAAASPGGEREPEQLPVSLRVPSAVVSAEGTAEEPRTAAWATVGVGAALLLGGGGWAAANEARAAAIEQDAAELGSAYDGGLTNLKADRQAVRSGRWMAWGTAGVGAALIGGGLAWALAPRFAERAVIAPSADGVQLALRF